VAFFRELTNQVRQTAAALLPRLLERAARPILYVAAALSLEEVVGQILADLALQDPSVRVRTVFGASDALADHLLAGAPGDVFLSADTRQLDRLQVANLLLDEQRVVLAENGLAVIGSANRDLGVRNASDLTRKNALRVALAEPDCPLGNYTRSSLESLRLYAPLRRRALYVENSRGVLSAVRSGQADIGLAYASDATRAEGCRLLFRVPGAAIPICYCGAILSRGQDPTAARTLLAYLSSPAASLRFRECGFLPVHGQE
jgi:molybdate transport system substrate-binding protein